MIEVIVMLMKCFDRNLPKTKIKLSFKEERQLTALPIHPENW